MIQFQHVGLTVSDLEQSTKFYSDAFGFEPFFRVDRKTDWISDITGYDEAHLKFQHMRLESGMHLELIQYASPKSKAQGSRETYVPGNVHFCLTVTEIEKWIERARMAGGKIMSREVPSVITEGPNSGAKAVYIRDMDGITVELFERPK